MVNGGQSSFLTGQRGVPGFVTCSQRPPKASEYPGLEEINRESLYWVNGEKINKMKKKIKKKRMIEI